MSAIYNYLIQPETVVALVIGVVFLLLLIGLQLNRLERQGNRVAHLLLHIQDVKEGVADEADIDHTIATNQRQRG